MKGIGRELQVALRGAEGVGMRLQGAAWESGGWEGAARGPGPAGG